MPTKSPAAPSAIDVRAAVAAEGNAAAAKSTFDVIAECSRKNGRKVAIVAHRDSRKPGAPDNDARGRKLFVQDGAKRTPVSASILAASMLGLLTVEGEAIAADERK